MSGPAEVGALLAPENVARRAVEIYETRTGGAVQRMQMAIAEAMNMPGGPVPQIRQLERQRDDLHAACNLYLQRARDAEALSKAQPDPDVASAQALELAAVICRRHADETREYIRSGSLPMEAAAMMLVIALEIELDIRSCGCLGASQEAAPHA